MPSTTSPPYAIPVVDSLTASRDTGRAMSRENVEIVREIYSEAAEGRFTTCLTLRKGRVVRFDQYPDRQDALEAVGLRE